MPNHPDQQSPQPDSSLLARTFESLLEGITGVLASERKDKILSAGHLLQALRSSGFLKQLKAEWDAYCSMGRIKDDYVRTDQHQECLQELLDSLDVDAPDHVRFAFLKKILLSAATERSSTRESLLPQQYMRIARSLSSGEVIVLLATYRVADNGQFEREGAAFTWLMRIAEESGLRYPELVEIHERGLVQKNLLTRRTHQESAVTLGERFRLTQLGHELCMFIETYEEPVSA